MPQEDIQFHVFLDFLGKHKYLCQYKQIISDYKDIINTFQNLMKNST